MTVQTELEQSWDRLSAEELDCIDIMAVTIQKVSPPMADFLKRAVEAEMGHRDSLKVKPRQVPDLEDWSDRELSHSYMAAITISEASHVSERLSEWGSMLLHTICLHMSSRLEMRHIATELMKQCDRN